VIVGVHIPKTGGMTKKSVAFRQYERDEVVDLGNGFLDMRAGLVRLARLGERPDAPKLVWGHIVLAAKMIPDDARVFTMLREPVQRSVSEYNHYLDRASDPRWIERLAPTLWKSTRPHSDIDFRSLSLDECIAEGLFRVPDNLQTRILAGRRGLDDADASKLLGLAMRNLQNRVEIVGLTERFDESLALAGRAFGWTDLAYQRINVRNSPALDELDPSTRETLERENELDVELYALAETLFQERVSS